jgi:hypothetical protein
MKSLIALLTGVILIIASMTSHGAQESRGYRNANPGNLVNRKNERIPKAKVY